MGSARMTMKISTKAIRVSGLGLRVLGVETKDLRFKVQNLRT